MRTTISEKGQITVPKQLRERLGLRAGDTLDVIEHEGRLVASKAVAGDPVAEAFGVLSARTSTDEVIRELRGVPDAV